MNDWLWFFPLAAGVWYWWDTLRTKEIARAAGRGACERVNVQFLDDTVVRNKIWLRRNAQGRMQLKRRYDFEFASDGERRYHGSIEVFGVRVSKIDMDAYRATDESGPSVAGSNGNVTRIH